MSNCHESLTKFEDVVQTVLDGWTKDVQDLKKMVSNLVIFVDPLVIDSILQAPHATLLKTLLETPNMEKAAKAAALLALWRSWLKKLCAEGPCMDSVLLKSLGAVQDALIKVESSKMLSHVMASVDRIHVASNMFSLYLIEFNPTEVCLECI